ncbi:MAG: hypothetical protein RIC32_05475 [Ekhidna sp.]|jgi:hypothetical protein
METLISSLNESKSMLNDMKSIPDEQLIRGCCFQGCCNQECEAIIQ